MIFTKIIKDIIFLIYHILISPGVQHLSRPVIWLAVIFAEILVARNFTLRNREKIELDQET